MQKTAIGQPSQQGRPSFLRGLMGRGPSYRPSDYAGNPVQQWLRWGADRLMPGNQRGTDGTLQNEGLGLAGLGLRVAATPFLGPMGGMLVNHVSGNVIDRITGGPGEISGGKFAKPPGAANGYGTSGDLGKASSGGMGSKFGGGNLGFGGWYGSNIPGAGGINPYISGGSLFGVPGGVAQGFDQGSALAAVFGPGGYTVNPGALSFGGGRSGYNNGTSPGTGFGVTNYQNDAWGDTAAGFGIGVQGMSGPSSYAISDAFKTAQYLRT